MTGLPKWHPGYGAASMVDLFYNLNDAVALRIDQDGAIIDDGVPILSYPVFLRNLIVSHAAGRKISATA